MCFDLAILDNITQIINITKYVARTLNIRKFGMLLSSTLKIELNETIVGETYLNNNNLKICITITNSIVIKQRDKVYSYK